MRQGISTRYMGPTNNRGSRIKALARKRDSIGKEMSHTRSYSYDDTETEHCRAAQELAAKLGWSGLWVGGGKPEEDGFQFVNIGQTGTINQAEFKEGKDWFFIPRA